MKTNTNTSVTHEQKAKNVDDKINKLVIDLNYKAKKHLLKTDKWSAKTHRKNKQQKEIINQLKSVIIQKLRLQKTAQNLEQYNLDKKELKNQIISYFLDKKQTNINYRKKLKQAKLDAIVAKYALQRKNILIDTQETPHQSLKLEQKKINITKLTNLEFKARIKRDCNIYHLLLKEEIRALKQTFLLLTWKSLQKIKKLKHHLQLNEITCKNARDIKPLTALIKQQQAIAMIKKNAYQNVLIKINNQLKTINPNHNKDAQSKQVFNLHLQKLCDLTVVNKNLEPLIKKIKTSYQDTFAKETSSYKKYLTKVSHNKKAKLSSKNTFSTLLKTKLKTVNELSKKQLLQLKEQHPYIPRNYVATFRNTITLIQKNKIIANCCASYKNTDYDLQLKYKEAQANIKGGEETLTELLFALKQWNDEQKRLITLINNYGPKQKTLP